MNQVQSLDYINKAYLHQKTWAILDQYRASESMRLPTGRRVSQGHYFSILQLIELAYIDYKHSDMNFLTTNRGNLAHAFKCSERTTYN